MKLTAVVVMAMLAVSFAETQTLEGNCVEYKNAPSGCDVPDTTCSFFGSSDIDVSNADDLQEAKCPEDPENNSGSGVSLADFCKIQYGGGFGDNCGNDDDCTVTVDSSDFDSDGEVEVFALCFDKCKDCFTDSQCEAVKNANEPQFVGFSGIQVAPEDDDECFDSVKALLEAQNSGAAAVATTVSAGLVAAALALF